MSDPLRTGSEAEPAVALIAAAAENGVIGRNNQLPWHLPEDLRYFKRVTLGKPIIMGRKTFDSIGRPLPGRLNIVVSRDPGFHAEGVKVVGDVEQALSVARGAAVVDGVDEVVVIGGAEIYRATIERAQRLYLTRVHAEVEGDAYFPTPDWAQWEQCGREDFAASESNPYRYSFIIYRRRGL